MPTRCVPLLELRRSALGTTSLSIMYSVAGYSRLVAQTRLREDISGDPELLALALVALRPAMLLNHQNILQTFDLACSDVGEHYLVTEYCEGLSLEALFECSAVTTEAHVRVLCDVLAGLHHAHELVDVLGAPLGIVHRSLSPSSVLVTFDGQAKLLDFDSAWLNDVFIDERPSHFVKISQMAPEQVRGGHERVGRGADIFAVGAMLFRTLAGRNLWAGLTELEIVQQMLDGRIPSAREAAPNAPAELAALCDQALAPRPERRFATALAFQQALEGYLKRQASPQTHKQLGQIVADLAADERLRITETIEAHLREHGEGEAAQPWVSCQSVVYDDATTSAEPLGHPYRGSVPRPPRPAPPGAKASRPRGGKPPFETLLVAVAVLVIVANWLTR
jgi:eukaryotic-like serine/threonine-protein kinase